MVSFKKARQGQIFLSLDGLEEDKDPFEKMQKTVEIVEVAQEVKKAETAVNNVIPHGVLQEGKGKNILPLGTLQEEENPVATTLKTVEIVDGSQGAETAMNNVLQHGVLQEGKAETNVLSLGVLPEDKDPFEKTQKTVGIVEVAQ